MAWVESLSPSFSARHESAHARQATEVLDDLEEFRESLSSLFEVIPSEIAVVMHARSIALSLAHPWLPLARRVAAPASRRYFAGWFAEHEIHVLAPNALERRASAVAGSREALILTPRHEFAHLVLGANNPDLPPPFSISHFRQYVRWAWLCEGAAAWLSGQTPFFRAAIVRRMREGGRPEFPPAPSDAMLLGGTVFTLLERRRGTHVAAALATSPLERGALGLVAEAFDRPVAAVERDWREELDSMAASA